MASPKILQGTTLPSHDVPLFSIAKGYHKEIKPDAGMLQMEVQHGDDAYGSCINGKAPHPKNWSKMKCVEFLNDFPVTISQETTILQNQKRKERNEKMREHMSINIENKNNQTIVGSTMIIMVFAYLVIDN